MRGSFIISCFLMLYRETDWFCLRAFCKCCLSIEIFWKVQIFTPLRAKHRKLWLPFNSKRHWIFRGVLLVLYSLWVIWDFCTSSVVQTYCVFMWAWAIYYTMLLWVREINVGLNFSFAATWGFWNTKIHVSTHKLWNSKGINQ